MRSNRVLYLIVICFIYSDGLMIAAYSCDINTSGSGCNDITDIHIIGFFPCTNPNDKRGIPVDNCDGIEDLPIMELALEEINERCDLLPGYRLVVDYANSGCSSIPAVYHLIQQTDPSQPTKLMILGPACSGATTLMGEIAERFFHIPQVTYTASSPLFGEDKKRFPRFYRMVPITKQLADGCVALIEKLHWKRISIISHEDEFYFSIGLYTAEKLTNDRVLTHVSFTSDPSQAIKTIKELNARIMVAWIPNNVAIALWCMAIKEKLTGPDFVWFLPAGLTANWWTRVGGSDCTADEMRIALEHSLGGSGYNVLDNDPSRVLVSNKNVEQFKQDLEVKKGSGTVETDVFHGFGFGFVYDAVWTIALAMNSSISTLEEKSLGKIEDFTYDSAEIADVFTEAIANLSFQGITGKISFQNNGNRNNPAISLFQYRDGVRVSVLSYNPSNGSHCFSTVPGQSLVWQGGYIPKDAPVPEIQHHSQFEVIITIVITSFGILSTLYFSFFNIYYRNHVVVKRSSYRLNSLILIAAFVGFTGTLLFAIELDSDASHTKSTAICNIRYWMTELAFVACFGTLFVKIWRLYKVFFNKNLSKRKYLKDQHLLIMICCIVAPTLLLLIVQAVLFPITLHSYASINEDNFAVDKVYYTCKGEHYLIFNAVLFIGDTLLGLLSAVMAFKTKKHIPADKKYRKYHESAVINLTTMMALILSTICEAIIIVFLSNNIKNGILLIITLRECFWLYPVIFLLFSPKVYRIYYEILWPREQPRRPHGTPTTSRHTAISVLSSNPREQLDTVSKWRRRVLSNGSFALSNNSNNSSFESDNPDSPQQSSHEMVAFTLDPNQMTQEPNIDNDSNNCVIFTNIDVVSEAAET